jgi:zinc transport system ATP-binding protein
LSLDGEIALRCAGLVVGHGGRAILPPIDFDVRRGSFHAVLGRNGAGKSTFLMTLLGLLPPIAGRVERSAGVRCGYVPQVAALDELLPVKTVEVVRWGQLSGWSFLRPFATRAERAACDAALAAAGATDLARQSYRDLSMGQKQRVLFARLLAIGADVAVLDEPTAAMDAVTERETLERLAGLARRGVAVLVVAHDLGVAKRYADVALYLDRDDGVATSGGVTEVLAHPSFVRHYGDLAIHHD